MWPAIQRFLSGTFTTRYAPGTSERAFETRSQTRETPQASVTVAVLTAAESHREFGVSITRKGVQAVYLRITNRHTHPLRLCAIDIAPHYYTPLEAAGLNHFSVLKRLSAFGLAGWIFLPLFLLLPFKLITAARANRRMDDEFRSRAFPLRPLPPGETAEGFVFTPLDAGSKTVHVTLYEVSSVLPRIPAGDQPFGDLAAVKPIVDLTFVVPIPGIASDYLHRDFATLIPEASRSPCTLLQLIQHLRQMPPATTNAKATRSGDPVNLVVIGDLETLLSAFTARWDECETISLATCWKTARAFLLSTEYRYSPVSPLYMFGRSQDLALQRIRNSINERLHLRLWLTPLLFEHQPVWVGQISRDIGVRFTLQTWNLTTHRIDPNIDESRDYVVEDLFRAERVVAVGYVDGVGACGPEHPRHNLTGDPFFTDGKRAVIMASRTRTEPQFVSWS